MPTIFVGGALQVADARLEFVDDAQIVGVADDLRLGLIGAAHEAGGFEVAGAEFAETNAGEIEGEGDGEEGHGCGHRETRLHMVWPRERKPLVRRVRKGMTLAEAKAAGRVGASERRPPEGGQLGRGRCWRPRLRLCRWFRR